jgi:hypothetical protein
MQKLIPVEEAKVLMNVAKDWGVWRWLMEKKRVRAAADQAVDALGVLEKKVKASWSDDLKKAYRELEAQASLERNPRVKAQYQKAKEEAKNVDPQIKLAVRRVKEADDEAETARLDAEATFDQKAVASWELREKAIRKAEALARRQ